MKATTETVIHVELTVDEAHEIALYLSAQNNVDENDAADHLWGVLEDALS